jgi:hypothetical protein
MRLSMLVLLAITLVLGTVAQTSVEAHVLQTAVLSSSVADSQGQPDGKLDIDIDINKGGGGGGRWYENPMWIAIGGLAAILVLALIIMAGRGGGTTVVKG